jgi:hypothetical protein
LVKGGKKSITSVLKSWAHSGQRTLFAITRKSLKLMEIDMQRVLR